MAQTVETNLPTPLRALAIAAHPDDAEFGCGATLAKWASAGCAIHHLICTDGSRGTWEPEQDRTALIAARQEEQRAASLALGGTGEVIFLGWPDGELEAGLRQRWEVCWWIRRLRPEVVLGHDPWRRYRLHPDHRNAGFLTTDGIVAARDHHFFPEQGAPPHRPEVLLLWEAEQPDHVEDVTGFEEIKIAALFAHRSQFQSTMGIDDRKAPEELKRFRHRILDRLTEDGNLADVRAGEAFKAMRRL